MFSSSPPCPTRSPGATSPPCGTAGARGSPARGTALALISTTSPIPGCQHPVLVMDFQQLPARPRLAEGPSCTAAGPGLGMLLGDRD